jgi:hypothetical protein
MPALDLGGQLTFLFLKTAELPQSRRPLLARTVGSLLGFPLKGGIYLTHVHPALAVEVGQLLGLLRFQGCQGCLSIPAELADLLHCPGLLLPAFLQLCIPLISLSEISLTACLRKFFVEGGLNLVAKIQGILPCLVYWLGCQCSFYLILL